MPALSPMLRVIAKPGISILAIQTLKGPNGFPAISFWQSTLPPAFIIFYLSLSNEGLWSMERGTAANWWGFICFPTTARESPTFPQSILFWKIVTVTKVDPDRLVSKSLANISWFVVYMALSMVCFKESTEIASGFKKRSMFFGKFLFIISETLWPFSPWPSQTAKKFRFKSASYLGLSK